MGCGLAVQAIGWLGGTLGALAATGHWRPPPFTLATLVTLLGHGPGPLWPGVPAGWLWAGITAVIAALTTPAAAAARQVRRRWSALPGLARLPDLAPLTSNNIRSRTRRLRPALAHAHRIAADDTGILIGAHHPTGKPLRASWEDVTLAVMAPRSGKSTALAAPAVLRAPGPVLLTSNKADVYAVTRAARAATGQIWTFDPQNIAYTHQDFWWDMLAEAATLEGARRLAGNFIASTVDAAGRKDFWFAAAANLLAALFHAAARTPGRTINDVLGWLALPADRTPVELLDEVGMPALSKQLEGTIHGAPDTRDGIYETARQCTASLLDPAIATWVTPAPGTRQFLPREFARSRDTLYLLSKDGGGSAAGVIAAATDAVIRAAILQAERQGGRIDPPMIPILDEAANICRIPDLPALYSHLGSRGLPIITILQSYRQGVTVWGEPGMDALWSAATIKILGAGLDDADFVEKISRLIGSHKTPEITHSYSPGGTSTSVTRRRERTLQAADIRALPKGWSVLLATGIRPALITLDPWYQSAHATQLGAALERETAAITARALQTLDPPEPGITARPTSATTPPATPPP
ncbi:TraM recognition domain-containing protein [Actinomadura graeca]|uniref:TraM recognition domain-containing protein n=2 Tax=Actinomadura graeca TaxID=2750812 RepID=A0ABX8R7C3_9ACTN|nr:TraM recognition domain-containing protein [Actinomadura graeca]